MTSPTRVTFPSFQLTIVGHLWAPSPSAPDRKGAAVVISHPMTGVKEQTSDTHARYLSEAGFYALTFDAGYQGESTGSPRGLEDPHQRVEDNKAAVTYLSTLKGKVDPQKIGMLGICASGGYCSYAAQSDIRVKGLATVSAACVGRMTRTGGVDAHLKENAEAITGALQFAAQWRTDAAINGEKEAPKMLDVEKALSPEETNPFNRGAGEYYGTSRGKHERSTQRIPPTSYDLLVPYDSFNFQHLISPRPLLMIAGAEAETLHYSEWAVNAAKEPKELFVIEGSNHFTIYDDLSKSGPKLVEFFEKCL